MDRVTAIENKGGRNRHRRRGPARCRGAKKFPIPQQGPDREKGRDDGGKPQGPEVASEKGLAEENRVEMERSMIVGRIVMVKAVDPHLVGEPPVDALVEMRRLDIQQDRAENGGRQQNTDFHPGEFCKALAHAIEIVGRRGECKPRKHRKENGHPPWGRLSGTPAKPLPKAGLNVDQAISIWHFNMDENDPHFG